MNNYLKILLHLKKHEGDGKQHPVEHLFPESSTREIENILIELQREGLISYSGRDEKLSFILSANLLTGEKTIVESPLNEHIYNSEPTPYHAKITFKGSKYLKEELQMQESGKYNIAVSGQGAINNFVIESSNVTIDNKTNFYQKADEIIETLNNDASINNDTKSKAISTIELAKSQIQESGKVSPSTIKTILEYASFISSIGQLALALLSQIKF